MERDFWLVDEYLPELAGTTATDGPPLDELADALGGARIVPVPVPADCPDGFFAAFWARPEAYLDPTVQAGHLVLHALRRSLVPRRDRPARRRPRDRARGTTATARSAPAPSTTGATGSSSPTDRRVISRPAGRRAGIGRHQRPRASASSARTRSTRPRRSSRRQERPATDREDRPAEPIDRIEPTEPIERIDPFDAIERIEPLGPERPLRLRPCRSPVRRPCTSPGGEARRASGRATRRRPEVDATKSSSTSANRSGSVQCG